MARPRKVKPEDSLHQLDGASEPEPGTYVARRAKAALRADESRRLGVDETRERMAFTEEQLRILDCIAAGLPVRAAREAIAALRLKADFLLSKPAAAVDHRVGIAVVNPYPDADALPAAASAVVAALPEGQAPASDSDDEGEES
jgi:hypothetical protein